MTYLVTGGAGFIGSNFVLYVHRKYPDYRIVNLDKLTYAGNLENLRQVEADPRHIFLQGDICDSELVAQLLERYGVDVIINFAAESHVDRSILGPEVFLETNVIGTFRLLEASLKFWREKNKHNGFRFLHVSTDEVYGSLGPRGKFTESTPLHPNSPYAASKASGDLLALAYHHTFGLPIVITRCSNNYGPYQFPEKLIPLMIINAMSDKPLPVYGDGGNVRDWLHVDDHCAAIDLVLHRGRDGEIYNIGGNTELKNIDVVRLIIKNLGKPDSLISFVKDRPGHDRRYAIDAGKIERDLGWRPRRTFDEGIVETIEWYRRNETWWKRIISGEYQQYYKQVYENRM